MRCWYGNRVFDLEMEEDKSILEARIYGGGTQLEVLYQFTQSFKKSGLLLCSRTRYQSLVKSDPSSIFQNEFDQRIQAL